MKVSCILTSYNRPQFVRQALRSVEQQTYRNFELIVMDESDPAILDILDVIFEFKLPAVKVRVSEVRSEERAAGNRLAIQINRALEMANGDLIVYLADDDYYHADWFERGVKFFKAHPGALQAFGSLHYTTSREMNFSAVTHVRFYDRPITEPFGVLDHGMVMHRRSQVRWPTGPETMKEADGHFFRELAKTGAFYPIMDAAAVVKRLHPKCLQKSIGAFFEGVRE